MAERTGAIATGEGARGFVERRLVGPTFVEALRDYALLNPGVKKFDISTDPAENEIHFEKIDGVQISQDGQHALAIGHNMDRSELIKDGKTLITGRNLSVHAANNDFSRIIVLNGPYLKSCKDLSLVVGDEVRRIRVAEENLTVLGHSADLNTVFFSYYGPVNNATFFQVFREEQAEDDALNFFGVTGKFYDPRLVGASPDFARVVWQGEQKHLLVDKETYVFENDKPLTKGWDVQAFANEDASSSAVFFNRDRGFGIVNSRVAVVMDGKRVFEAKSADTSFSSVVCAQDLRAIAQMYNYEGNRERLLIIGLDKKPSISDPFDRLNTLGKLDNGDLAAVITRKGVNYQITVPGK